jgi:hypothetical protein
MASNDICVVLRHENYCAAGFDPLKPRNDYLMEIVGKVSIRYFSGLCQSEALCFFERNVKNLQKHASFSKMFFIIVQPIDHNR